MPVDKGGMTLIAALPMYDWPEQRAETDHLWARLRDNLHSEGIDAPQHLARRNADLPHLATLDPEGFDLFALWRHPDLLLAQTCWGPMGQGLEADVCVVGQPDYSRFEGGEGILYSSAILRRGEDGGEASSGLPPLDRLRDRRLAFNGRDSMSGLIALTEDLATVGAGMDLFSEMTEGGSHRNAIRAVAAGDADLCAIDCRTLDLARRFEPAMQSLSVIGWTAKRKGLPFITASSRSALVPTLRQALQEVALITEPASR